MECEGGAQILEFGHLIRTKQNSSEEDISEETKKKEQKDRRYKLCLPTLKKAPSHTHTIKLKSQIRELAEANGNDSHKYTERSKEMETKTEGAAIRKLSQLSTILK
ncbi:hypothetical protein Tco_1036906 [Tanacetum coccineum]